MLAEVCGTARQARNRSQGVSGEESQPRQWQRPPRGRAGRPSFEPEPDQRRLQVALQLRPHDAARFAPGGFGRVEKAFASGNSKEVAFDRRVRVNEDAIHRSAQLLFGGAQQKYLLGPPHFCARDVVLDCQSSSPPFPKSAFFITIDQRGPRRSHLLHQAQPMPCSPAQASLVAEQPSAFLRSKSMRSPNAKHPHRRAARILRVL